MAQKNQNKPNQQRANQKITEFTPYEQLFNFYSQNENIWGGAFTLELLSSQLTVNDYDKYWVVEKLISSDVLIKLSVSMNNHEVYTIGRGVEKVFRWLLEARMLSQ